MTRAIRIHATGGPEVMTWEEVDVGPPGAGEVRLRHHAIGLNFIDVYHRTGLYPQPLPFTPGVEGAGVVEAVGAGVTGLSVGDRVAYAGPSGGYAEERLIPADRLVKLPDAIDFDTAAAMMLKGLTAEMLLRRVYRVKSGDAIVVHAAAGGVGLILCQWAAKLGATVIGTVSTSEKAALASARGCTHPIVTSDADFIAEVTRITGGAKVAVVYDSVGKDTFLGSLDCLAKRRTMVSYGNASGPVDPFPPALLAQKGSLFLTRPTLFDYIAERGELEQAASDLFALVADGSIKVEINQRFALRDAPAAHRALEARQTTGSTVLTV